MVAAFGLPVQKRIEGHHVLDFHRRDAEGRRDGGYRLVGEISEAMLNRLDNIQEPAAVRPELFDGGAGHLR